MENIQLKRIDGTVILEGKFKSIKDCLMKAIEKKINLSRISLNNVDLSNVCLSNAALHGASFIGVNLDNVNARNVDFTHSIHKNKDGGLESTRTNFTNVSLNNADLRGSNLILCNFTNVSLNNADLRGSNLKWTILDDKVEV